MALLPTSRRFAGVAKLGLLAGSCLALAACGGGGGGGGPANPSNRAPVLSPIGPRSLAEGATLTIDLSATDPEGDAVTYDSGTYPAFVSLVPLAAGLAELRVAPGFAHSGSYPLTVRVRDTAGNTDEETFTLTVTDVPGATNLAPELAAIGNQTVAEGQVRTVALRATDADNHGMAFSATGLPAFAALTDSGGGNGSLRLTPGYSDSGTYPVTVRVTDNGAPSLSDTESFTITVTNTNQPPQITAIADHQVVEGMVVNIPISATDAEGQTIALTKQAGPAFATVTDNGGGNGNLRLAPGMSDSGVYTVTVRAADNGTPSSSSDESLVVTVVNGTDNQVALENQLAGTDQWRLTKPINARQIEGFASATSVNRGSTISLYTNTSAATFQLEVFRMGWYQGLGARRVFGPQQINGTSQSVPSPNGTTGLVDAAWTNPYVLDTETDGQPWSTGVYLAKLTSDSSNGGWQSYIIFVVRDDAHTPDVLFGLPVTTYQAYNAWGGRSLYPTQGGSTQPWGSQPGPRAVKVSFNRPYAASHAPEALFGAGAGEFLTNTQPISPNPTNYPISASGWDYNMIRWLEYEQYDVGYVTNVDYHRTSAHLNGVEVFLSPGHDEYWSWQMFDNVEDARDAGIDLAFFSANTAYRQIRFEASPNSSFPAGSPEQNERIIIHYRERVAEDPVLNDGTSSNDYLATVEFRDSPVNRPEQNLLGVQFVEESGQPVDGDIIVSNAGHAIFARTGLTNGARLAGLLGYEVDGRYGGFGSIVALATSPFTIRSAPFTSGTSHMTIYSTGNAEVFATGSIQWSWGLDDFNWQMPLRGPRLSAAAQQITDNVLERFGATGYVPDPVSAQCIQLRATAEASGNNQHGSAAEIDLLGPDGIELDKTSWTITANSQETSAASNPATNAIDGFVGTIWHSQYTPLPSPPLPYHELTINLGTSRQVSALRYLPRQDSGTNGTIARYEIYASSTCAAGSYTLVGSGDWQSNKGRKIARFTR